MLPAPQVVEVWNGVQQPTRVRMTWVLEQNEYRSQLDDPARVHDRHAVGYLGHDAEIVRDEQDGGAKALLQISHESEDLRLNGDVKGGRRFIGDKHPGTAGQCHCNHHSLQHSAGKLVRILPQASLGLRDMHQPQHFDRAKPSFGLGHVIVMDDGFGELTLDGEHRIERTHRLLEDHRDLGATYLLQSLLG